MTRCCVTDGWVITITSSISRQLEQRLVSGKKDQHLYQIPRFFLTKINKLHQKAVSKKKQIIILLLN